jgi:microcin C transport system permease protein
MSALYRPPHSVDARFRILFVSFVVVQFASAVRWACDRAAPGADTGGSSRISGSSGASVRPQVGASADAVSSKYRGAQGFDPAFIKNPSSVSTSRRRSASC